MSNQDNDKVIQKTSTISVGRDVNGNVITGDNNTTTSNEPKEDEKAWWVKIIEWIIGKFNCK